MKTRWVPLVILFMCIVGSCNPSPSASENSPDVKPLEPQGTPSRAPVSTPSPGAAIQESETQTNPSLPIPALSDPQALIEKAKADLAQRLSVSDTQISLVKIDQVIWSDASLGCPQAGMTYAQAQVSGYLILLKYAGDEFEYHTNIHGNIFYCENPTPPLSEKPVDINP
jgi:hypothetical protein